MSTDTKRNDRNYGLDLLKILCMLAIVGFHFTDHGAVELRATLPFTFNWMVLAFAGLGAGTPNCVFMLISGYFLVDSTFKVKNIVRLYGQVWFYSVLTGVLAFVFKVIAIDFNSITSVLFPFSHNAYWYFTAYMIVYLIFPYLNVIIDRLNKAQHRNLFLCGIVFVSYIHLVRSAPWVLFNNQIPLFIVMYLVGAYIKRYGVYMPRRKAVLYVVFLITCELTSMVFMRFIYPNSDSFEDILLCVYNSSRLMPIITSIVLFLLFKDISVAKKAGKFIGWVAPSVFGVYLLHIGWFNRYIFIILLNDEKMYETPYFIFFLAFGVITIFAAGILVDKFRSGVLERLILPGLSAVLSKADRKAASVYPDRQPRTEIM